MYLSMTVDTGFSNHAHRIPGSPAIGQTRSAIKLAGMVEIGMAGLAQIRWPNLQKICLSRTMRIVAVGAIFTHRGVFPQEGTALFRMATITGLIDGGRFQQTGAFASTVRVVALCTFFRAIPARHHRIAGMAQLCTSGLMTSKTNARTYRIADGMQAMAIGATHPAHLVRTAQPTGVDFVVFVAAQAGAVPFCGRGRFIAERLYQQGADEVVLSDHLNMPRPAAVTILTARQRIAIKCPTVNTRFESLHLYFVARYAFRVINTCLVRPRR